MKKLFVGLTVLLVHTAAAHAQQPAPASPPEAQPEAPPQVPAPAAAPTPQEMPPAYAPPPGYYRPEAPAYGAPPVYSPPPAYPPTYPPTYPPPDYRYRYAPAYRYPPPGYYAYPPPQPQRHDVLYRPFTLGGGIGFGGVVFNDAYTGDHVHQGGLSYTFRMGFGLRPGLLLLWDVEGAAAEYGSSNITQTANLVALQIFVTQRLFIKGGFGLADAAQDNFATQWGAAAMGGIGFELVQGWNWSFDLEATVTGARLNNNGDDQTWTNWSLVNFVLNFF